MRHVTGMVKTLPLSSIVLFVAFIALLGLPPFGLFMTEFLLLSAGMEQYPYLVIAALLSLAVVFFGFLRHLMGMFFGEVPQGIECGESNKLTQLPLLLVLALLLVLSWYLPETLSELIELAARGLSLHS